MPVCVCYLQPWRRGAGSTDVSLSEPNMKHRKRPLWSLPTCQSALHRDRLLRLLMCCTDRPETHMQTQTPRGKKKKHTHMAELLSSSLPGVSTQTRGHQSDLSPRRYNHDDQRWRQSEGLLFYIWIPISLSGCEARSGSTYTHLFWWTI